MYILSFDRYFQITLQTGHTSVLLTNFCVNLYLAAKSLQLCPTLCDPIDESPIGSSVPGILQARTLEWVAISLSSELISWYLPIR